MVILSLIAVLFIAMIVVLFVKGQYLAATVVFLAMIGLSAINGPLDNYFENLSMSRSLKGLFGGQILSSPYRTHDKYVTDSVME